MCLDDDADAPYRSSGGGLHSGTKGIVAPMMVKLVRSTVLALWLLVPLVGSAAPQPDLWRRWLDHDPHSMRTIDHRPWEQFLLRHLRVGADGIHRIAYAEVELADRAMLDRYIDHLAGLPIERFNRDEQMAYWINLYNALVVQLVLDHYPIESILDIARQPNGPWDLELITVDGVPISLNDIHHRILRPIWRDPRVHYALNCGAVGCPNLQPVPFEGTRLDRQLTEAAMAYVNDARCIRFDDRRLVVSSIFRWYRDDFGGSERDVISHLMAYAEPELALTLQHFERVSADVFSWRLNDAS